MVTGRRLGLIVAGGALAAAALGVVIVIGSIQAGVRRETDRALQAFPAVEDPVLALLEVVQSDRFAIEQRNKAVWAVGRLGDERALPVLLANFHPDHCDHGRELCQHELAKAIKLCGGRAGG